VRQRWLGERRGVLVGDLLAKRKGWKVGDRVVLSGTIFPGDWEFTISGFYTAARKSVDRNTFWFHWNYLNDSVPEVRKDQIGWIAVRVDDPRKTAETAVSIDKVFDVRDVQTLSQSERAFNVSFLAAFSSILTTIDVASLLILFILALIVGLVIYLGVRERTSEYGVMKAIGFQPSHVLSVVLGEAAALGLLGGLVGTGLSTLAIGGLGPALEEMMPGFFPYFRVQWGNVAIALAAATALGTLAGVLPARRALRMKVVDALRRLD
jgi:putative ABC transport system permease protein